jgi:hypothetical protein
LLDEESVKQIAHGGELTQTTRLLLCLAVGDQPKSVAQVKDIAVRAGISGAKKCNISSLLSASKGTAINTPKGWELSKAGKEVVEALAGPLLTAAPPKAATSLRAHLSSLTDPDTRAFVEEPIACFEHKLYRAAVGAVMGWRRVVAL